MPSFLILALPNNSKVPVFNFAVIDCSKVFLILFLLDYEIAFDRDESWKVSQTICHLSEKWFGEHLGKESYKKSIDRRGRTNDHFGGFDSKFEKNQKQEGKLR